MVVVVVVVVLMSLVFVRSTVFTDAYARLLVRSNRNVDLVGAWIFVAVLIVICECVLFSTAALAGKKKTLLSSFFTVFFVYSVQ